MHEADITSAYLRERRHFYPALLHVQTGMQASKKEKHMVRTNVWMKLLTSVLFTVTIAFAQSSDRLPVTDAEKIVDALRGGPAFITKNATVRDWPSVPGGEYRVLRKGSSEWTCLPAIPGYPHDEPGCFDPIFLRWMQDSLGGRTPQIDRIGISYMYFGPGNPKIVLEPPVPRWPTPDDSQSSSERFSEINRDPSNGMPCVAQAAKKHA